MAKYMKTEAGYQEIETTVSTIVESGIINKMDKDNPVGTGSFSMGRKAGTIVGDYSHAEGSYTTASGYTSHAEGSRTTASGPYSHAEGSDTNASSSNSHAEGSDTNASSSNSHAEGYRTTASGYNSHAEGSYTTASGYTSHAEGSNTVASTLDQHVSGSYNILDPSLEGSNVRGRYIHIVGNGLDQNSRSNAHTLDWSGNAWFAGDIYVGSTSGTDKDDGSKKLATEEYVAKLAEEMPDKLPNPNALTFTGAATGTYDGSAPLSVEIPSGGSGGGGSDNPLRLVRSLTLAENTDSVNINTDDEGNTFSLSECYLYINAKVTSDSNITYLPNGYWVSGTYMTSANRATTSYPYGFLCHCFGGADKFFGYEIYGNGVSRSGYDVRPVREGYRGTICSFKVNAPFASGAQFLLYGRDA